LSGARKRTGVGVRIVSIETIIVRGNKILRVHPQYVVDENQQRTGVLLTLAERKKILDYLEELDDIHAYDEAKAGSQETILFEQAVREIDEGFAEDSMKSLSALAFTLGRLLSL